MAEENHSGSQNKINMEATAYDQSKMIQIGHLTGDLKLVVEQIEPLLKLLEARSKAESVGTLKAGSPSKSLAHWQGRDEEIAQLRR